MIERAGYFLGTPWELMTSLRICVYTTITPPLTRIAHLPLPGLRRGQVIKYASRTEVTNPTPTNIEMTWCGLLSLSASGAGGYPLSRPAGENVTPNQHHFLLHDSGSFEVPHDGDFWYGIAAYAGTDDQTVTGLSMQVNNWGSASVEVSDF